MNHCRRCDSDYERPGSCNCFAEKVAPQTVFVPWMFTPYPSPFYVPWTFTNTTCAVCGRINCTDTHITYYYADLAPPTSVSDIVRLAGTMMGGDTSHMMDA